MADHPRRDGAQQGAPRGAGLQDRQRLVPIKTTSLDPGKPFCERCGLDATQKIVDELHLRTTADGSKMHDFLAHRLEHRSSSFERLVATSDEKGKLTSLSLPPAAG